MVREFSVVGVSLRKKSGEWHLAAIEPQKEVTGNSAPAVAGRRKVARKVVLALPKGLVDEGEKPEQTALREVREETGITATVISKLGDIKYVYVRSWGDRERVFKIVSFYLLRYQSGRIDDISSEMRVEVRRALWLPIGQAGDRLAYRASARWFVKLWNTSHPIPRSELTMPITPHVEKHFTAGLFVRDVVIGMADG